MPPSPSRPLITLRPALRRGIPLLALGQGLSEAGFIFSARLGMTQGNPASLVGLGVFAALRFIFQDRGAALEVKALTESTAALHQRLLGTLRARAVPAYRPLHRRALARALDETVPRAAEGLLARRRFTGSMLQIAILVPGLFLLSWKLAVAAIAIGAGAWAALRLKNRSLKKLERSESAGRAQDRRLREDFENRLEAATGDDHEAVLRNLGRDLERTRRPEWKWRRAQARYPAMLETGFFFALMGLVLAGASALEGWNNWILFSALLLLAYRPVREAARHYPTVLQGAQALDDAQALLAEWGRCAERALPAENPSPDAFALRHVDFAYDAKHAVFRGFSAEFSIDQVTGITGPNGAGKTTLLRLLSGAETPDGGSVLWAAAARRKGVAYLPQRAHPGSDWPEWARALSVERPAFWAELDALLAVGRLTARLTEHSAHPEALSGGERQRMALARALASDAAFLLLDEPTTALPGNEREAVLAGALKLWKHGGSGCGLRGAVIVSHERFAESLCDDLLEIQPLPDSREHA